MQRGDDQRRVGQARQRLGALRGQEEPRQVTPERGALGAFGQEISKQLCIGLQRPGAGGTGKRSLMMALMPLEAHGLMGRWHHELPLMATNYREDTTPR
jgi:hypothetical protein